MATRARSAPDAAALTGDETVCSVIFCSRREAESMPGKPDGLLISITDSESAKLQSGWRQILRLAFHDVEPEWVEPGQRLMDKWQAELIVQAVMNQHNGAIAVVIHCQSGISRSGAVAFALCERWNLPFDGELKECNRHVLALVRASLALQIGESGRGA